MLNLNTKINEALERFDKFWDLQFPNSHPAEYGVTRKFFTLEASRIAREMMEEITTIDDDIMGKSNEDMRYGFSQALSEINERIKEILK